MIKPYELVLCVSLSGFAGVFIGGNFSRKDAALAGRAEVQKQAIEQGLAQHDAVSGIWRFKTKEELAFNFAVQGLTIEIDNQELRELEKKNKDAKVEPVGELIPEAIEGPLPEKSAKNIKVSKKN